VSEEAVDSIRGEDLLELLARPGRWCVSIYLPAPVPGGEPGEGPLTAWNLLRDAEERLLDRGLNARQVDAILDPARRFAADHLFWRAPGTGVAVFLSPEGTRVLRLPRRFAPSVDVGERHRIAPLVPLLAGPERFFILALSENRVRLLRGSRDGVSAIEMGDIPRSLTDALGEDDANPRFTDRPARRQPTPFGSATSPRARRAGVHDVRIDFERYFTRVDAGVSRALRGESAPLVLAAVRFLLPIYRAVNSYPHVLDGGIEGNPDATGDDELYRRALRVVGPIVAAAREAAIRSCRELLANGSGRAVDALAAVLPAADAGCVACLVVAAETRRWGRFDRGTGAVFEHDATYPGDEDLIELAIVRTLENRGGVHVVAAADVPGRGPVAAVLRC
jgi:Bacterial archaeo-eukaryotic release factor family 3